MDNSIFSVDILDRSGHAVGSKLRSEIVKGRDIYHAVYGVIITPKFKIAVSVIANRQDLPNLHAGSLGCTAATIRRTGEDALQAMNRAINDELGITAMPELLYEDFITVDSTHRKVGVYIIKAEVPTSFSKTDIDEIKTYSKSEFQDLLTNQPERITPVLKLFWEKYRSR